LAEQDKAAEQQHSDEVPQNQHGDSVGKAEPEMDAQGSQDPVDGRQVGSGPDPELAGHLPGSLGFRDGLQPGFDIFVGYWRRTSRHCRGFVMHVGPP
jgi:hypothetical protein